MENTQRAKLYRYLTLFFFILVSTLLLLSSSLSSTNQVSNLVTSGSSNIIDTVGNTSSGISSSTQMENIGLKRSNDITKLSSNEYTGSSSITITSNQQLESHGFPGDGTENNPYRIEYLNFSGSSENLISISDTSVHVEIQYNLLNSGNYGIYLSNSSNVDITNNTFVGLSRGIYGESSGKNISIVDNTFTQIKGIYFNEFSTVNISDNYFDNSTMPIYTQYSNIFTIHHNYLTGNKNGIRMYYGSNSEITANILNFYDADVNEELYAIYLWNFNYANISQNYINNTKVGVIISDASHVRVVKNDILNSLDEGLVVYSISTNINVTLNNFIDNNFDEFGNYAQVYIIEDINFTRNYYNDHLTPDSNDDGIVDDPYWTYDGQDAEPVTTRYDFVSPAYVFGNDITYEGGPKGQVLSWDVHDANPSTFSVYIDDSVFISNSSWVGSNISFQLDNLEVGTYDIKVVFYDIHGYHSSDEITVTILRSILPSVSSPADFFIGFGTSKIVSWILGDSNPWVYNITVNNNLVVPTTNWENGSVSYDFTASELGTYELTIAVYDGSGNMEVDEIEITVIDINAPVLSLVSDIIINSSSTDNYINWTVSDPNPGVYNITLNDILLVPNTEWENGYISVNIDDLDPGIHELKLTIYDSTGNSASDSVSIKVLDEIIPELSEHDDVEYESGSTGNELNWKVYDNYPGKYNVTIDGRLSISDTSWENGNLVINIDGFDLGLHTVIILISDLGGNSINDTVIVEVVDSVKPTINNPGDLTYVENSTGNNIVWSVSDLHPGVYNISIDGILYRSANTWENGEINVNIDGLTPGEYVFSSSIYDSSGNSVSDTVNVEVIQMNTSLTSIQSNQEISDTDDAIFNALTILLIPITIVIGIYNSRRR